MKPYNPRNWYWIVNGSTTQVFSSASGTFVSVSDPTYVEWGSDGTIPTNIGSAAELGEVLAPYAQRPADTAVAVLDGYKGTQANGIAEQALFKVMFNHENRIRALERSVGLNNNPPNLTAQQAVAAIKVLL